jgi:hypothetical protein
MCVATAEWCTSSGEVGIGLGPVEICARDRNFAQRGPRRCKNQVERLSSNLISTLVSNGQRAAVAAFADITDTHLPKDFGFVARSSRLSMCDRKKFPLCRSVMTLIKACADCVYSGRHAEFCFGCYRLRARVEPSWSVTDDTVELR